jgi:hypothetical protein
MGDTPQADNRDRLYFGSLEIHRRIEGLCPKVRGAYFRAMHTVSRRIPQPIGRLPIVDTDRVFYALAIRAAATKESIVLLCEAGHGESAIALSRVLVENAVLMAWQRLGPGRERLETYILFASALHERVVEALQYHRTQFPDLSVEDDAPESDPAYRAVAQAVFQGWDDTWARFPDPDKPGKLKKVTVAQMFRDVVEKADPRARTFEYDMMYHMGSEHIHTGPHSLSYILARVKESQTVFIEPLHAVDSRLTALAVSNVAMLSVLNIVDEYVGLDLEAELQAIVDANRTLNESIKSEELS